MLSIALLIHGVGLPSEDLFGRSLEHVSDDTGIGPRSG